MDNLEKYIKNHREEFDSEEPRSEVWNKIKDAVVEKEAKVIPISNWLWKAAAIVLLATTSLLLLDKWQPEASVLADEGQDLFVEEFANAEQYYLGQIDEMQSRLTEYTEDEVVNTQFMSDLQSLDSLYNNLKTDFKASGSNEKIADALIQNLRIRMQIMDQQLMILERIKRQTSDENIQI